MFMLPHFYYVEPLFRKGFGYGDQTKPKFADQVGVAGRDFVTAAENLLLGAHVLIHVGYLADGRAVQDDGCGDGRPVRAVTEGNVTRRYSLYRPKVFGGGVMMATAMRIGLGQAAGESLVESFSRAMALMDEKNMDYGVHTDGHATGSNSGCGAIDNAPLVLRNIQRYRLGVTQTIAQAKLGLKSSDVEAVLNNFAYYISDAYDRGYNGNKVVSGVKKHGKVVKQLNGEHQELFILLNDVVSMTANQSMIRDATGGRVQVYCVDMWRMREIAQALYGNTLWQQAFISELVYTLGVAATLTRGDLPVYYASLKADSRPVKLFTATV